MTTLPSGVAGAAHPVMLMVRAALSCSEEEKGRVGRRAHALLSPLFSLSAPTPASLPSGRDCRLALRTQDLPQEMLHDFKRETASRTARRTARPPPLGAGVQHGVRRARPARAPRRRRYTPENAYLETCRRMRAECFARVDAIEITYPNVEVLETRERR